MNSQITLNGTHGLHPVGGNTAFARGGHEDLAENNPSACVVCHGPGTRSSNVGTVLSVARDDRILETDDRGTITVSKGTPIGCSTCH